VFDRVVLCLGSWVCEDMSDYRPLELDFFHDISWSCIPEERKSVMTHVSLFPRMGLLGGGPKSSKLAALAAARKKAAEGKKSGYGEQTNSLDRLLGKKEPTPVKETSPEVLPEKTSFVTIFRPKTQELKEATQAAQPTVTSTAEDASLCKAKPSPFAQALCGVNEHDSNRGLVRPQPQSSRLTFGLPYIDHQMYLEADPFSKPSPDDVILAAQQNSTLSP
jgi:elongation factor 1 alpha-like protein